jgi:protein-L-isoaspartate(D-aspartate) O-methyltransferase
LEVGTGSGYQAAVLSLLVKQVYSIEIVTALAQDAAARLRHLGYGNVAVRSGDGYRGWQEHAPFDAIIVTAAAPSIPPPLLEQLKPGGRMLIPVGAPYNRQILTVIDKNERGKVTEQTILPVAFVPLTGEHAQESNSRPRP